MTKNRRIFQPFNLIIFLLFALAAEVTVCLPFFEDANVLLQISWAGYLLLGMGFLFFIGGKIASGKNVGKYLADSEKGKFWLGLLLFFICMGIGAAFRLQEIVTNNNAISASDSLNLLFYIGISFITYLIVRRVSGFGGAAAVTIFLALCPLFDFSVELSTETCLYSVLFLGAILLVVMANPFSEGEEPGWKKIILTILGAMALAGATFLHISAVAALFPCMFFLIRKSGLKKTEKGRIERCFLFTAVYACVTVVIFILHIRMQNAWTLEFPVDYELFQTLKAIGNEPENALIALFEKLSNLFTVSGQGEFYNGLLMGILLFGIIRAILLFTNKIEKNHFPVYLLNWYILVSILLDEFAYSKLLLFILLICVAAGTMADLGEAVIARKKSKLKSEELKTQKAPELVKNEETKTEEKLLEKSAEPKKVELGEGEEEKETDVEAKMESNVKEEKESETTVGIEEGKESKAEADAEPAEKIANTEPAEELEEKPIEEVIETEPLEESVRESAEESAEASIEEHVKDIIETDSAETGALPAQMEKQIQELLNREELIIEIMEKQSTQIFRLEQELKEQRILARKRELHYRQQFAKTRNKKNRILGKDKGDKL